MTPAPAAVPIPRRLDLPRIESPRDAYEMPGVDVVSVRVCMVLVEVCAAVRRDERQLALPGVSL
jgi:hypothetical protein